MPKSFINANGVEVKRCSKCKQVKPVSKFSKNRSTSDGYKYACKACQAAYLEEYYKEHRGEIAAYSKEYYEVNRDEIVAQHKEYEQTAEGREVRRKVGRKYRQTAKGREAWRKAGSTRRALKLGATVGDVNEAAVYELSGHACIYCGATTNLSLDHIVPLARGGAHSEENLVVACRRCNSSKGGKPLVQWLQTQPTAVAWVV